MNKRIIPNESLKEMAHEHISYEIQMLAQSYIKLSNGKLNIYEQNSAIETLLLHARCLYDFLYPSIEMRSDDVIADDFLEDATNFRNELPDSLPISGYLKKRTGKELAHLTYQRLNVTPEQKIWNLTDVHDQIVSCLRIFFKELTEERRGWFTTTV